MHPASPDENPAASSPAFPSLATLANALGVRTHLGSGPYALAVPVLDFLRSDVYRTVPGDIAFVHGVAVLREAAARAKALADGLDRDGKLYLSFADEPAQSAHAFREWALDEQPRAAWQEAALARAFVRLLAREVRTAARMRDIYTSGAQVLDGNPSGFPSLAVVDAAEKGEPEGLPSSPPARFISVYSVEVRDGGPEEGGWTWTRQTLRATFALPEPVENYDPEDCPPYLVDAARAASTR